MHHPTVLLLPLVDNSQHTGGKQASHHRHVSPSVVSQPRVNLIDDVPARPTGPVSAVLIRRAGYIVPLDRRRLLQQIRIQPSTYMPGDVAMEGPHSRVIAFPLQDQMSICRQQLHVPPLGVGLVHNRAPVPSSRADSEDLHFVPVKVPWVGSWGEVVKDHADCGVTAKVVDVPFWVEGVGSVAGFGEE